ncbi:hypothetical protein CWI39_0608p0020 [Hamiltosporidium magnivora]|uniref:C2H2-type domain-containing protein n=1 Tax=Hamiltosporidium magnivora TaxID=148818 RepID=A0A4Q9LD75_9MICR|nr:hypothetical protein CWI39_0608p0020 [Hamiltosporidium magnivora]
MRFFDNYMLYDDDLSLEERLEIYKKNEEDFEAKKVYMNSVQYDLESFLLDFEKRVYFGDVPDSPEIKRYSNTVVVEKPDQRIFRSVFFKNSKPENEKYGDVRIYKCYLYDCDKEYTSSYGLKYHLINGHSKKITEKPYRCTVSGCSKKYKNSNGLKYHLNHGH